MLVDLLATHIDARVRSRPAAHSHRAGGQVDRPRRRGIKIGSETLNRVPQNVLHLRENWTLRLILSAALLVMLAAAVGFSTRHEGQSSNASTRAQGPSWRSRVVGQTPSPGSPCGPLGSGCVGTTVQRLQPSAHPCYGAKCGTASVCTGSVPECGRCHLDACTAIGSAWIATSLGTFTICSDGLVQTACNTLIDSRRMATVIREEYFCVTSSGGQCHCNVTGGSKKAPCPCLIPVGNALINPCA